MEGRLQPAEPAAIETYWRDIWGLPVLSLDRAYNPSEVEGLIYCDEWGEPQGLITWHIEDRSAEIVTVDAFEQGRHIGGRLLDGAEKELGKRGVRRVTIMTTNDNLRALSFYMRHGYRLVAVHLDAMDRVRRLKPDVPRVGHDNIPLQDVIELVKETG